jgi:hypothetical protein
VDGCPLEEDLVPFSIPMKGIPEITPTLKNIINKFTVRYFIKVVIMEKDKEDKEVEVESNLYEIILYK